MNWRHLAFAFTIVSCHTPNQPNAHTRRVFQLDLRVENSDWFATGRQLFDYDYVVEFNQHVAYDN